ADHALRLTVASRGPLAREATAQRLGGVVLALLCGAREQLAHIGVDSEDEWNRVEYDPRQVEPPAVSMSAVRRPELWREANGASIGDRNEARALRAADVAAG